MDPTTVAANDQNYALAKELLTCPIDHAKQLLAEHPHDEALVHAIISGSLIQLATEDVTAEESLPFITDQLAAAAIRLAKVPTP